MQLERRDKRALIAGAVIVVALLAYLLWPSGAGPQSNVELVAADQRKGVPPPPGLGPPMQVQPVTVVPVAAAAAPAGAVPEGLTLTGVTGSGAIFASPGGTQRFVPRGREVAPGLTLQAVSLRHVILATPTATYRLGFGGAATALQAPSAPAAAVAPPAPQFAVPGAGRNPMGGPLVTPAQQQQLSRQFVAGLEPRQQGGQVTGWTIRPGATLPALSQAGLQPGDVLVSVNGEAVLDREQVAGLAQQIADSRRAEFEFERGGQRMRRSLDVNPGR